MSFWAFWGNIIWGMGIRGTDIVSLKLNRSLGTILLVESQGDQIVRIFAERAIVYLGMSLKNYRNM
jgi:hypothetical protein